MSKTATMLSRQPNNDHDGEDSDEQEYKEESNETDLDSIEEDLEHTENEEETDDEEDEEECEDGIDPNLLLDEKCFRQDAGWILNLIASSKSKPNQVQSRRWLIDQIIRKALNNDETAYRKFTSNSTCMWDESSGKYKAVKWNHGKKPEQILALTTDYSTWILPCECKDNKTTQSSAWVQTQSALKCMDDIRIASKRDTRVKCKNQPNEINIHAQYEAEEEEEKEEVKEDKKDNDAEMKNPAKRARVDHSQEIEHKKNPNETFSLSALMVSSHRSSLPSQEPKRKQKRKCDINVRLNVDSTDGPNVRPGDDNWDTCMESPPTDSISCLGIRQTILSQCLDAFDGDELQRILVEIVKAILIGSQYQKWCDEYQRLHGVPWE